MAWIAYNPPWFDYVPPGFQAYYDPTTNPITWQVGGIGNTYNSLPDAFQAWVSFNRPSSTFVPVPVLNGVLIGPSDPVPPNLPAGCLIVRKPA